MIKADEIEAASDKKRVMSLSGGQNRWGEERRPGPGPQTVCVRLGATGYRIRATASETRKTELKHSEMWQLPAEIVKSGEAKWTNCDKESNLY